MGRGKKEKGINFLPCPGSASEEGKGKNPGEKRNQ